MGEGEADATGAGADVDDVWGVGQFAGVVERHGDEGFGFGAGDEDVFIDIEAKAEEFFAAGDVGDGDEAAAEVEVVVGADELEEGEAIVAASQKFLAGSFGDETED